MRAPVLVWPWSSGDAALARILPLRRDGFGSARTWWNEKCLCFFEAEDGIRDYKVTGVQTCALPIYLLELKLVEEEQVARALGKQLGCEVAWGELLPLDEVIPLLPKHVADRDEMVPWKMEKIGRASCRERV